MTQAAKIRLRPRIMTSVTTMMGFVSLAASMGDGADLKRLNSNQIMPAIRQTEMPSSKTPAMV